MLSKLHLCTHLYKASHFEHEQEVKRFLSGLHHLVKKNKQTVIVVDKILICDYINKINRGDKNFLDTVSDGCDINRLAFTLLKASTPPAD